VSPEAYRACPACGRRNLGIHAGDELKGRTALALTLVAHGTEAQNTRHLVACRAIVAGDLRLDDHLRRKFGGYEEIGRLRKVFDALGAPCLTKVTLRRASCSSIALSMTSPTSSETESR